MQIKLKILMKTEAILRNCNQRGQSKRVHINQGPTPLLCVFVSLYLCVCVCVYVRVCSSVYACVTYGGVSSTYIKPNVSSKREKENPNEEIKLGTWKNLFATWRNWWRHLRFQLPVLNITVIALCQSKQLKQTKPQPLNKKLLNLPTLPDKVCNEYSYS